jgi:hypothetical protein
VISGFLNFSSGIILQFLVGIIIGFSNGYSSIGSCRGSRFYNRE